MTKLLSDDDVFGPSSGSKLLTDDEVFGGAAAAPPKKQEGSFGGAVSNALAEGILGIQGGIGGFIQAPGANLKSAALGANAVLGRLLPGLKTDAQGNDVQQVRERMAQGAAAEASAQRAANVDTKDGTWLNPRTAIARFGLGLQEDARTRTTDLNADNVATNPELVRQQQAVSDAKGFVPTLKALKDNPLALTYTLARSVPDMALGLAAGRAAAVGAAGEAALTRASVAGAAAEAGSSAYNARESTFQQVMGMSTDQLQASPRFQELASQLGDPLKAREALANELADQTPLLTAAGTAAGTLLTNKIFGGDATAKALVGAERIGARETGKHIAQDAVEEVLQGLPEDAVQHAAVVQADPKHELDIGGSIAQNAVAGVAMGAGGHGARYGLDSVRSLRDGKREGAPPAPGDAVQHGQEAAPAAAAAEAAVATAARGSEQTEAERALLTPTDATALDRVGEISAERARVDERLAELNRPDAGYGEMFDAERQELGQRRADLEAERTALTKDWPTAVDGAPTSFSTEAGVKLQGHYALMDAGALVTSHDTGLRPNPTYPQELQPRERERAASEMQVAGIVQKIDPARLGLSADAATGAPIVGADGLVESGNARTIALKRIYTANGAKADTYRAFLRDNAAQFGITPEQVDGMAQPVLVRVRDTAVNRAEFARQANAPTVAAMSPSEQARSDARRVDSLEDLHPDESGDFSGAASRPFVRRFMAKLPQTEQAGMLDAAGNLSAAGYARVRNAVLAKAYGDSPVLQRMVESMDDNLRNVSRALTIAAPRIAQMRADVEAGARHAADITPDVMTAVEELSRLKDSGTSVSDALAQAGLLGEQYSPETKTILQFLADNARRPRRMADFLVGYAQALDQAGNPNQGSLLDDNAPPSKAELMGAAQRSLDGTEENTGGRHAGEDAPARESTGERPAPEASDRGNGEGAQAAAAGAGSAQPLKGGEWRTYGPETGTLGIPRADMPQFSQEHRGALVKFLEARGITDEQAEVDPTSLKPTQAEFSVKKVERFKNWAEGRNRAVLVSSDNHVLDGHHQWMAKMAAGEPVRVIRFDAPIRELLAIASEFPSATTSDGATAGAKVVDLPTTTNFKGPEVADIVPAELLQRAESFIRDNPVDALAPAQISDADRAEAMGLLAPKLKLAADAKPGFDAKIVQVARQAGALGQKLAPVKGGARAAEKVVIDYDMNVDRLGDLLRATVVVARFEDASKVMDGLSREFQVVRADNKTDQQVGSLAPRATPDPYGYADINVRVRLPSGLLAEVQINVPGMMAAKGGPGHKLYEVGRAAHGTPQEAQAQALSREIYAAALAERSADQDLAASTAARNVASSDQLPLRGPEAGMRERASSEVPSSESMNQRPSGNLTNESKPFSKNEQPSANLLGTSMAEPPASILSEQRAQRLQDLVADIAARWKNAPDIVVVQNLQDPKVPPRVREADLEQKSQGATGEPEGFYYKGKVYLVAGELATDADAQRVLFHEALGHHGLRGVFGDALKPMLSELASARPDLMAPKARSYGLDLKVPAQRLQVAEEVLAELAQAQPRLGWVRRAVAEIRTWLRANVPGFKDMKLTDDEIVQRFIVPARGFVQRGAGAAKSAAVEFSRAEALTREHLTAAQRAEEIIQRRVGRVAPIDAVARAVTKYSGIEKGLSKAYDTMGAILDRVTPESVKAGIVSDYGVPEAVIDQRAMLQGRQRVQLRQAGRLLEKLGTLTRAESRVAYAWMNEQDPTEAQRLMADLPPESVAVLKDVQQMVDRLSRDAVALGQLTQEAYERNRFAYLRRSYATHVLAEQGGADGAGSKKRGGSAISIGGEQYKGRGLTETATMAEIRNGAPDWWKRKLVPGRADTSLKGERFVRLERRAPSGEGTGTLEGMEAKGRGKLLEVNYFPVGEQLPAKYSDWDRAGEFEVRDVKGKDLVLWRDFTKAEREAMGEIDEARFAIAKTLHGMIHDVEVGRYLEWIAHRHAVKSAQGIDGTLVEASELYRHTFGRGDWVQVPETKIPGTDVAKYGKLAGRYLPGPIWNDLRQTVNGQFKPFGDTYSKVLTLWKTAKTALSPAVHTNNVMSNFVMADWHDVGPGHVAKALRIILGASERDGRGALGRTGNAAARAGIADGDAARQIMDRYKDSGGDIGSWATTEIANDQLAPLMEALQAELEHSGESTAAHVGVFAALQHASQLRFPEAWAAAKGSKPGKVIGTEAKNIIQLYQAEDDVFRLAAWLKAKEGGATDLDAGKVSRKSFLDYSVNAPWVQAMRTSFFPFIAFSYRAIPMLLETAAKKPHKLLKLMALAGAVNALGVAIGGGGKDDERKLLPEEKAGGIWGMVPKLIRMPWNDQHGSPVYLDVRRFIPVGDVVDIGQGQSAIPIPPSLQPGGPLVVAAEVLANRSLFTGQDIVKRDTDTAAEQTGKVIDHLFKAFAPNILLPNPVGYAVEAATGVKNAGQTYAWSGVADAQKGRTDAFGRELSVTQAAGNAFGVKMGSYPADVLRRNLQAKALAQVSEIEKEIAQLKRQRQTNRLDADEFAEAVRKQNAKIAKVKQELAAKLAS